MDIDGHIWLNYEIGRETQEREFFVVSEMNREYHPRKRLTKKYGNRDCLA